MRPARISVGVNIQNLERFFVVDRSGTGQSGYYIDVGASELIANGSIKLKSGGPRPSGRESFSRSALLFDKLRNG